MATQDFNATSNSGSIYSDGNTSYTNARDGLGSFGTLASNDNRIGQRVSGGVYQCYLTFVEFDLTSFTGNTITAAQITLYDQASDAGTPFTTNAAIYDYSTSVTSADWRTASQLSALTVAASRSTSGMADPGSVVLAETSGSLTNVLVQGQKNRFVLYSSRHASGSIPSGDEYWTMPQGNDATHPAVLNLTYTAGVTSTKTKFISSVGFF